MKHQASSAGSHAKTTTTTTTTRSETEKEKTKLRERQRRGITTKIFHGLRKHGGYQLSPRADINEVLRHLAMESGWIIEPDGTTYRSNSKEALAASACPVCGSTRGSATATPTSSVVVVGGGGDCSTTASPRRLPPNPISGSGDHVFSAAMVSSGRFGAVSSQEELLLTDQQRVNNNDIPLELYMYGRLAVAGGLHAAGNVGDRTSTLGGGGGATVVLGYHHHHIQSNMYLQQQQQQQDEDTRASNDNTPVASPLRRA